MSVKDVLFGGDSGLKNKNRSRAVSPVIGVILMVVITVILAGVISVAVLDFGGEVSEGAPQASVEADFNTGTQGEVAFTHSGGDSMEGGNLKVFIDGTEQSSISPPTDYSVGTQFTANNFDNDSTAGADAWAGEDVRVVYDDGQGNTATLYTGQAPN